MADRKKRSKGKIKKTNLIVPTAITCLVLFVFIFAGIAVAANNYQPKLPEYSETDVENITENSTEKQSSSAVTENTTKISTENSTSESSSASTTSEPYSQEPATRKPISTGSFYDGVTYRSPDALPADIFKHGRNLMLLNRQYELPESFKWDLVYWSNGNSVDAMYLNREEYNSVKAVDRAAYQPLKDMFAAAQKAGVPLELVSAYRSIYLQNKLFTRSVNSFISQGYSKADAINKANYERTFSGTSEHNTGLGFDILQKGNFTLTTSFENTEHFKWLMENAENYGFILRYAKDKTTETGIMYEPWHFRYVGIDHAKKINELGMCLEEYINYLEA